MVSDNPFIGWWDTRPWHCIEEAMALDDADRRTRVGDHRERIPHLRPGRQPNAEISRIAREKGISRDAARKWLKRHRNVSMSG